MKNRKEQKHCSVAAALPRTTGDHNHSDVHLLIHLVTYLLTYLTATHRTWSSSSWQRRWMSGNATRHRTAHDSAELVGSAPHTNRSIIATSICWPSYRDTDIRTDRHTDRSSL